MSHFYNKFIEQCALKRVSPSKAAENVGLSRAAPSGWKAGAIPNDANIMKLADYFGCEAWELAGRSIGGVGTGISFMNKGDPAIDEEKIKTATFGDSISKEAIQLSNNREELKRLVDRLTDQEVADYLADFRKTILGQ